MVCISAESIAGQSEPPGHLLGLVVKPISHEESGSMTTTVL